MQKKSQRGRPVVTGLTESQKRCLSALCSLIEKNRGVPPSVQELADSLKLAPATAHVHLQQLIKKGYVQRTPGVARGLQVIRESVGKPKAIKHIPILGEVVAGMPLLSEECCLGELAVDGSLLHTGNYFALRIKGDSMRDAGMLPGDYVVVRQQPIAESGDIVVALVDGEATIKRLKLLPTGDVELVAENPRYRPIQITANTPFLLLGKVIATSKPHGGK
jgi:repressor LexA